MSFMTIDAGNNRAQYSVVGVERPPHGLPSIRIARRTDPVMDHGDFVIATRQAQTAPRRTGHNDNRICEFPFERGASPRVCLLVAVNCYDETPARYQLRQCRIMERGRVVCMNNVVAG